MRAKLSSPGTRGVLPTAARVLLGSIAISSCLEMSAPFVSPDPSSVVENGAPGTRDWLTSNFADQNDLAIWAAPYAITAGDTLSVFIHSTSSPLAVAVFRLGWYGGSGARLHWTQDSVDANPQPACAAAYPGPVECRWTRTLRIRVAPTWASGIYLIKATNRAGKSGFYPFVVRSRNSREFVVVVPQLTWQAYNAFGGSSLYTVGPDGHLGHVVSFERPYAFRGGAGYLYGVGYSNDASTLMWLEREGFDVSYVSDEDVPAIGGDLPLPQKGLIFIGHDEYWTMDEFTSVLKLRDRGYHLAFMAGNSGYWRVRLSPGTITGERSGVVTCYKDTTDPGAATPLDRTTTFRSLGFPENSVVGAMYVQHAYGGPFPLVAADSPPGSNGAQFLVNAGLRPYDTIPGILTSHVSGWPAPLSLEGDQLVANGRTPTGIQVLFRAPYTGGVVTPVGVFETTFYVAGSGAGVFDAGINEWGRYLSGFYGPSNSAIESVTKNILDWMSTH